MNEMKLKIIVTDNPQKQEELYNEFVKDKFVVSQNDNQIIDNGILKYICYIRYKSDLKRGINQ
ncbi:MAG: hypothetical protein KC589_09825 [Nanoarchaeota archaeon]|nr:hypothetical protein [Nanoarchaeota archaeon]